MTWPSKVILKLSAHGAGAGATSSAAVDAYYEDCLLRGANITSEVGDRPFAMRDFRVEDPSGNMLGDFLRELWEAAS